MSGVSHAQSVKPDDNSFDGAFNEIKRNDSLQFEFTAVPPPPPPPQLDLPQWLKAILEFFSNIFGFIGTFFLTLGPLLTFVFWLGVGAFIMAVLYLLGTTLMAARLGKKGPKAEDTPAPLYQPEQAQARILLEEVDALAAQGKYAEAVHTLLFRSIQDIDANRPNVIRRSLTSREIGGLTVLTGASRQVFASIAAIVERSFFGGENISKVDFDTARADYLQLAGGSGKWAGEQIS